MKPPRLTPIESALAKLTSGHGAQRLSPALQKLEIKNLPFRGIRKGQREFVKTILPRIKYHNTQLQVVTDWHRLPDRKGKSKKKEEDRTEMPSEGKATSTSSILQPVIHLHFDGLPSQELLMKDVSVTDITREMLALIQSTTKTPLEQDQTQSAEEVEGEDIPAEVSLVDEEESNVDEKSPTSADTRTT